MVVLSFRRVERRHRRKRVKNSLAKPAAISNCLTTWLNIVLVRWTPRSPRWPIPRAVGFSKPCPRGSGASRIWPSRFPSRCRPCRGICASWRTRACSSASGTAGSTGSNSTPRPCARPCAGSNATENSGRGHWRPWPITSKTTTNQTNGESYEHKHCKIPRHPARHPPHQGAARTGLRRVDHPSGHHEMVRAGDVPRPFRQSGFVRGRRLPHSCEKRANGFQAGIELSVRRAGAARGLSRSEAAGPSGLYLELEGRGGRGVWRDSGHGRFPRTQRIHRSANHPRPSSDGGAAGESQPRLEWLPRQTRKADGRTLGECAGLRAGRNVLLERTAGERDGRRGEVLHTTVRLEDRGLSRRHELHALQAGRGPRRRLDATSARKRAAALAGLRASGERGCNRETDHVARRENDHTGHGYSDRGTNCGFSRPAGSRARSLPAGSGLKHVSPWSGGGPSGGRCCETSVPSTRTIDSSISGRVGAEDEPFALALD